MCSKVLYSSRSVKMGIGKSTMTKFMCVVNATNNVKIMSVNTKLLLVQTLRFLELAKGVDSDNQCLIVQLRLTNLQAAKKF